MVRYGGKFGETAKCYPKYFYCERIFLKISFDSKIPDSLLNNNFMYLKNSFRRNVFFHTCTTLINRVPT